MSRKMFSFGGILFLAATAVLVTPNFGQAQHRGGGARVGNAHVGAYRGGVYHGGVNSSRFYNRGVYHGGYNPGYRRGYPRYYGYGYRYPSYYGSYGASPYYYGYSPYSYDAYGYSSSAPAYDSGYYDSYGGATSPNPDATQADTSAHITVILPANAEIWVDGSKMTSTGSVREFQSPSLATGHSYTYEVRARWNQNGKMVTQTQNVEVAAGAHVNVRFPK